MKLTVQHLHNATTFICQLQPPGGTIGRGQQNDLNLPDPSGELSTLQAIVRMQEGGATGTVLNMSSMSRVAVNDTPLGLSQEANVSNGDRITVGDYLIVVDGPPATSRPAAVDDTGLSATPYDTAAFVGTAAAGATTTARAFPDSTTATAGGDEHLPTWHPAYQAPAEHTADAAQPDSYPEEHPLGTPINRMPPPAPVPNTTVAPLGDNTTRSRASPENAPAASPADTGNSPAAAPVPEENPDDIFKDLLSGPGVLPVGGNATDERHPFDMESATNRNHHNPVELLKPEGMHHPSIDGDPLDALPSDGADKDRHTIFSDDSPTTLNKDTALDSHKQDNILETLQRAAHSGYKDKDSGKK
ncbi:FHA domain-containing protein [Advenella sp. FME57]|uniref:FHA domain-containing protein n=1 Tax=Advenella sp. FME57 TaxID=2742604 RepID=UPI0018669D9C|nr:FHA domain-containing protein [Advenella sp. FME57]